MVVQAINTHGESGIGLGQHERQHNIYLGAGIALLHGLPTVQYMYACAYIIYAVYACHGAGKWFIAD